MALSTIAQEPVSACIPWAGLPVRLSDSDVRVADLNGDHLPDLVRIQRGKITYWPGRGNGFFGTGDASTCKSGFAASREISMPGGAEIYELGGIRLDDVNGDGLDDLVQIRTTDVDVWLNIDGISFSERFTLSNTPVSPAYASRARLVDINGSGTRDILYGDARAYKYMDLSGGRRPWVLTGVDNGLGKTTALEYASTAALAKKAADAGNPWTTFSPSTMHVVVKETVDVHLDKVGLVAPPVVTEYVYRDPIYDGQQREFRGFGSVESIARGDASSPTSISSSTFLLGTCKNEFAESPDPCSFAGRWKDNPRESLKGLPLLSETRNESGVYLSTSHSSYAIRTLYTGLDGRKVRYAHGAQSDTWVYDTGAFVPATSVIAPSDTPDVWLESTPSALWEVPSKYPDAPSSITLRAGTYKHLRSETTFESAGNPQQKIDRGCIDCSPIDEVITQTSLFERPLGNPSGWMYRPTESWVEGNIHTGYRKRTSTSYDSKGNAVAGMALLSGSLALDRSHEGSAAVPSPSIAPAPTGASADGWISTGSTTYDSFGNATGNRGPNGRCHAVAFDSAYAELPISETVYAGTLGSGGCGTVALTSSATYDRGLAAATEVYDLHGEKSKAVYDGFGRVVFLHKPHPTSIGAITALPAIVIEYHLGEDSSKPISWVKTLAHDGADLTTASYREAYAYVDGMGRPVLTLEQADTDADLAPWVATGAVRLNAKGQGITTYRPWFFAGSPTSPAFTYGPLFVSSVTYDAFGRQVESYEPVESSDTGLPASRLTYRGLITHSQDRGQIVHGIKSIEQKDGHGRAIRSIAEFNGSSSLTTETEYLPTGEVVKLTRIPTGGTPIVRWLAYDNLGRMVRNVEPNTSKNFVASPSGDLSSLRSWRYAYNDSGDLVGTSDARGCGTNYHYDASGRLLVEDYSPCLNSHAAYSAPNFTTGDGTEVLYQYDLADAAGPSTTEFPIDGTLLLGRLVSVSDRGAKLVTRYDGRGRITGVAKKIAAPTPSDTLSTRYATSWTTQAVTLDAADRPLSETTGAKALLGTGGVSTISTGYTKRGSVKFVSSSYGPIITGATHDATGLPRSITYSDLAATRTTYDYDARLRPYIVQTSRSAPSGAPSPFQTVLNDSWFTYDASNNPISIVDKRIASEWPATAKPVDRTFGYDNWSRITSVTYTHNTSSAWKSNFDFENNGGTGRPGNAKPAPHRSFPNRITSESWNYDLLGNTITSDDDQHAFYDRSLGTIGNGTASSGPYQLKNATSASGGLTATYDNSGYLKSIALTRTGTCLPAGATCNHRYGYDWDEVGRLSRARRWDVAAPGAASDTLPTSTPNVELSYEYDSGDQRVRKTSSADGLTKHTIYILASLELRGATYSAFNYQQTVDTEVPYLFAHGIRLARVAYEPADVPSGASGRTHIFLFVADHLGSVSTVIDRDSSEVVEHGTTTPYGQVESDYRSDRWNGFREDYRFTGKEEDVEVGLTYFGFRYYAPALGRWISADPLAVHSLGADANVYAYVHGRVMSAVDPKGLYDVDSLGYAGMDSKSKDLVKAADDSHAWGVLSFAVEQAVQAQIPPAVRAFFYILLYTKPDPIAIDEFNPTSMPLGTGGPKPSVAKTSAKTEAAPKEAKAAAPVGSTVLPKPATTAPPATAAGPTIVAPSQKSPSATLADNMLKSDPGTVRGKSLVHYKSGRVVEEYNPAHHIVAFHHPDAKDGRIILDKCRMTDYNVAENGVFLPRQAGKYGSDAVSHDAVHTKANMKKVNDRLTKAFVEGREIEVNRNAVVKELGKIRAELLNGGLK